VYAEIRFAPLLHLQNGLTPTEVVEAVNVATAEGIKTFGVEAGILLCTLRHYTEAQSMETVQLVKQFKGTHVVGFDIAGDEAGFPIKNHVAAFLFANANGIPCTAHAGEAKGAESVWESLQQFHPLRIGHGARSAEDVSLLSFLKNNNIHLEVCPTSNIQTNIFDAIQNHTLNTIYNTGVSMNINTDCRTVSNVTLTSEYQLLEQVFNWTKWHFKKCNLNAIEHAFASEAVKEKIRQQLEAAYE
jgi:adenosine deaminase